jgi:2-polyprenyl-6-methoxyphenol hydroxylase-like FAD-dependent oxidoreductase
MYFMGLSATRFLRHWPEMKKRYSEISLHNAWIETYKHDGALMLPPQKVSDRLHAAGLDPGNAPGAFQMRPLVYKMLLDQVEKLGVEIEYGCRVVNYFEREGDKGGVELDDGTKIEGDLVVAADGIGSKANKLVGAEVRARSSGRAMWRAVMPVSCLESDPEVKEAYSLKDGVDPIVRTYFA